MALQGRFRVQGFHLSPDANLGTARKAAFNLEQILSVSLGDPELDCVPRLFSATISALSSLKGCSGFPPLRHRSRRFPGHILCFCGLRPLGPAATYAAQGRGPSRQ